MQVDSSCTHDNSLWKCNSAKQVKHNANDKIENVNEYTFSNSNFISDEFASYKLICVFF